MLCKWTNLVLSITALILIIDWGSSDENVIRQSYGCYGNHITIRCNKINYERILIQRIVAGIQEDPSSGQDCTPNANDKCRFNVSSSELSLETVKKLNGISENIKDECNGNPECLIHIDWIVAPCNGEGVTTDYFVISYTCIEVRNGFILPNVSFAELTSPVDLFSTGYPRNFIDGDEDISCGIEIFSKSQIINIRVEALYITFPRGNRFTEYFQVYREESNLTLIEACSDMVEAFHSTRGTAFHDDILNSTLILVLNYTKSLNSSEIGGKFWIRISVSDNSFMRIHCNGRKDQDVATESDENQNIIRFWEFASNMADTILGNSGLLMIILVLVMFLLQ